MVAGGSYVLELVQDATGTRTITWPGTFKWGDDGAPTLTVTGAKTDYIFILYDGTNHIASTGPQNI
jgi:hypothetical protein